MRLDVSVSHVLCMAEEATQASGLSRATAVAYGVLESLGGRHPPAGVTLKKASYKVTGFRATLLPELIDVTFDVA
jgi:hypothetical protein